MSEVTAILDRIQRGDAKAAAEILPVVYEELRALAAARLARESPGLTLQPTALVHEAYLRLVCDAGIEPAWNSRGHFFAAAAEAMRRILVEAARRKGRIRHGGDFRRVELPDVEAPDESEGEELLLLDAALRRFAAIRPEAARLVELRFFAGLTLEESAAALGVSERTAQRMWAFGRAWLRRDMKRAANEPA